MCRIRSMYGQRKDSYQADAIVAGRESLRVLPMQEASL